jgi:hypothetical protein
MTFTITPMTDTEADRVAAPVDDAGLGSLRTERGNLPLAGIDVRADITGLTARIELTQDFVNSFDQPLEATYVFPLPDRGAVTGMKMTADGRVVEAELQERGAAREAYDQAIASGRRASIAEEERPDVFTMRVGNIVPGERVSIALTMVCPLSYEDGEATFRFPLVVAPRYIPGSALPGPAVGDGHADDTDAVPDGSRITPPVLLPGFPNPVRLRIDVGIDPAGLELSEVRSSLHVLSTSEDRLTVQPGERANRDFVLRLRYGASDFTDSLILVPDARGEEGTFSLTVLPPVSSAPPRPRDLVLVLDRSGSMGGWKMVAARRAAARIVDTLTATDRFAVLTFDDRIDRPTGLPSGLVEATDRHRFRAVEHLARVDARGGTELLAPLRAALGLLRGGEDRDQVVVLVTDGQVGNEDQILGQLTADLGRVRIHTVGIDRAVNAGFLGRLASSSGGRSELVESEDRLDEAMDGIHRRIVAPLGYGTRLRSNGLALVEGSVSPTRLPDLFPGVPLVVAGRYRGSTAGGLILEGTTQDKQRWTVTASGDRREAPAVTALWARGHLRDLEDAYAATSDGYSRRASQSAIEALEKVIVKASLRFGVLCRFTAYVAVDSRVVAGADLHRVVQPVEAPDGWDSDGANTGAGIAMPRSAAPGAMPASPKSAPPTPYSAPDYAPPPTMYGSPAGGYGSPPGAGSSPPADRPPRAHAMPPPAPAARQAPPMAAPPSAAPPSARPSPANPMAAPPTAMSAPAYPRQSQYSPPPTYAQPPGMYPGAQPGMYQGAPPPGMHPGVPAPSPSPWWRRKMTLILVAIAVVIAAVVTAVILLSGDSTDSSAPRTATFTTLGSSTAASSVPTIGACCHIVG